MLKWTISQQEESAKTDDQTQADFVREGSKTVIRMRRVRVKSTIPATTEQLRHKFRLSARDTPTSTGQGRSKLCYVTTLTGC